MDRFIGTKNKLKTSSWAGLKSNMDRFIENACRAI